MSDIFEPINLYTSKRLVYSKFHSSDWPHYLKMAADQEVMKFITGAGLSESEALERFNRAHKYNHQNHKLGFLKALHYESGDFIGYVKMVEMNVDELEIGYAINPAFWGNGFATEMLNWMVHFTKRFASDYQLIGIVNEENLLSMKILRNAGFEIWKQITESGQKINYFRLSHS